MPLQIIRNDITKMQVDAIVNAANSQLRQGGGVCGAIFAAAGPSALQAACDPLAPCPTGSAVITPAFGLPAKHVIHAVGPRWQGGQQGEEGLLRGAYNSALQLALQQKLSSIAFPLISSGIYGYPMKEALRVAVDTLGSFVMHHDMMVYLVVFDRTAFKLSDRLALDL
ncbi:MAG: macro domain-containing protein [Clostridiales bacterium]|nr:macro domain-containing protein [Clostridiales bacterium]